MNILVLNHDYPAFLNWLYDAHDDLDEASFEKQRRVRADSLFGDAYFCAEALDGLGHDAVGLYINNPHLQRAWAREFAGRESEGSGSPSTLDIAKRKLSDTIVRKLTPALRSVFGDRFVRPSWFYDILELQFDYYDPDVVLNLAVDGVSAEFIREMQARYGFLLVGQIAAPVPDWIDIGAYDLMTSALPHFVKRFERRGIPSRYIKLAFEPSVLDSLDGAGSEVPASFVGSLSNTHESRIRLLEHLAVEVPLEVWAPGIDHLEDDSPLRDCYQGQAWGREMLEVLARSQVVVNNHIDVAGPYAANLRLYEATGVGSLLVTDDKRNIGDIFDPGEEVVTYEDQADCAERIRYFLDHDEEREAIAAAGQHRTLRDHTYRDRAEKLEAFITSHMNTR